MTGHLNNLTLEVEMELRPPSTPQGGAKAPPCGSQVNPAYYFPAGGGREDM